MLRVVAVVPVTVAVLVVVMVAVVRRHHHPDHPAVDHQPTISTTLLPVVALLLVSTKHPSLRIRWVG